MPSATFWNRIEPSPRASQVEPQLRAAIRDPLWLLARQWQMGEFAGEDAGSPAYMTVRARRSSITAWRAAGGPWKPLPAGAPLEPQIEAEPFTPVRRNEAEPFTPVDFSLSVELGQTFEDILTAHGAPVAVRSAVRAQFPLTLPVDADQPTKRFLSICAGRAIDGVTLYRDVRDGVMPAMAGLSPAALTDFRHWVEEIFGDIEIRDPETWHPLTLDTRAEVRADLPGGGVGVLSARPSFEGGFEWHSFDLVSHSDEEPAAAPEAITRSVFPVNVSFRGMPNSRWWDFENNRTDFGGLDLNRRDLAKLAVMEFMILHSNDWFVIPLELPVNSLCRIDRLTVVDVFGGTHSVERAQNLGPGPGERWSMFTHTASGGGELADFFLLPPTAAGAVQPGLVVEDVGFMRDPAANMAWAVERQTEGGIGQRRSGDERAAEHAPPPAVTAAPLYYLIETTVPEHWFPFLPVLIRPGEIALQRGAMLPPSAPRPPHGRILRPTSLAGGAYTVREEEVPRTGVTVKRVLHRTRWLDGSTHIWLARRRSLGRGEGASGLRFDLALTKK